MKITLKEYKDIVLKKYPWIIFASIISLVYILALPAIQNINIAPVMENLLESRWIKLFYPFGKTYILDSNRYFINFLYIINLFMIFYSINTSMDSIVKEQNYGNIQYLYLNPVTKISIYMNKFLAQLVGIIIGQVLMTISILFLYLTILTTEIQPLLYLIKDLSVIVLVDSILFLSIGLFISTLLNSIKNINIYVFFIALFLIGLSIIYNLNILDISVLKYMPLNFTVYSNRLNVYDMYINIFIIKIIPIFIFNLFGIIIYNNKELVV